MRRVFFYALAVAGTALALALIAALGLRASGAADATRTALGFEFDPPSRAASDAVAIARRNLRYVAAPLVGCLALRLHRPLRRWLDCALVGLLILNAVVVGVAVGAHGTRVAWAIGLHGSLELAAFSLAGGVYLSARAGVLMRAPLIVGGTASTILVLAAAVVETHWTLGGGS